MSPRDVGEFVNPFNSEEREGMCPPGWHRIVCDQLQIDALRDKLAQAEQERDAVRANADLLRRSAGECHLMISRNDPAYTLQQEWESTDLPPRLQKIMVAHAQAEQRVRAQVVEEIREWVKGITFGPGVEAHTERDVRSLFHAMLAACTPAAPEGETG